jgi:trehalose-phosphatase
LDGRLAILSGRPLKALQDLVGVPELIYGGNHGLELVGPGWKFTYPLPKRVRGQLRRIKSRLLPKLARYPKVWLEDKGATLSIQCREAGAAVLAAVERDATEVLREYTRRGQLKLGRGKKVFEIYPPLDWNKGRAARWLLSRRRAAGESGLVPVFFGDDANDEYAFHALRSEGVTVFVGKPRPTAAEFHVRGIPEVWKFLARL